MWELSPARWLLRDAFLHSTLMALASDAADFGDRIGFTIGWPVSYAMEPAGHRLTRGVTQKDFVTDIKVPKTRCGVSAL